METNKRRRLEPIAIATVLKFLKITDFPILNGIIMGTTSVLCWFFFRVVVAYYIYMCTHDKNKHSILLTWETSQCTEEEAGRGQAPVGREQQPARLCDASQASDWPLGGNLAALLGSGPPSSLPTSASTLSQAADGKCSYEFFPLHLWVSWNRSKHGQLQGSWRGCCLVSA